MNTPAQKITMTLRETYYAMREAGIPCNEKMISAGIASGAYPFGRVVQTGETGRRTLEIFRVDFDTWLETRIPLSMRNPTQTNKAPLVLTRRVM